MVVRKINQTLDQKIDLIIDQKVEEQHKRKLAYHYIRHSTKKQVEESLGSTLVQQKMAQRAEAYGFAPENIITVVRDEGRSATTTDKRDGFKEMLLDIAAGKVGAVFCSHTSRMARNARDMQQMIIVCKMTGTLIIDEESVYDPENTNDHLYLEIRAVLDEAEGTRLKNLTNNARLELAREGKYRLRLPVGFIWVGTREDAKIMKEPDQRVQNVILMVFKLRDRLGSAGKVLRYFEDNKLKFPKLILQGPKKGEYEWADLNLRRLLHILHDPIFAGCYVYGRSEIKSELLVKGLSHEIKRHRVKVQPQQWKVYIPNNHEGYISLEQYIKIQRELEDNMNRPAEGKPGAVRSGAALLSNIIFCGKCGYRMRVRYGHSRIGSERIYYQCSRGRRLHSRDTCQIIYGARIDRAVAQHLLQALEPTQVEISVEAAKQVAARAEESKQQWHLRLKEARQTVGETKDRFMFCNPRNRLVADNLETEWEKAQLKLQEVEHEYAEVMNSLAPPDLSNLQTIMAMAQNVQTFWYSEKMTHDARKRLLRTVIEKVFLTKINSTNHVRFHWRTGACTGINVDISSFGNSAQQKVISMIRELSSHKTDMEIATELNKAGLKLLHSDSIFTSAKVGRIRNYHRIPLSFPQSPKDLKGNQRSDGRYPVSAIARLLNRTRKTVSQWCREGRLDSIRLTEHGAWWIKLSEGQISELRR